MCQETTLQIISAYIYICIYIYPHDIIVSIPMDPNTSSDIVLKVTPKIISHHAPNTS